MIDGFVDYYSSDDMVGGTWYFPEQIVMQKLATPDFQRQKEHRIAFSFTDALEPGKNEGYALKFNGGITEPAKAAPRPYLLRTKDLHDICKLHHVRPASILNVA